MKLKLENDFEKGIATLLIIFGYIYLLSSYPNDWRLLWFAIVMVGVIKTIWTKDDYSIK